MRILVNNKIKRLFSCVLIFFILFTAASVTCVSLRVHYAAYCVLLSSLAMGIAVFASMYLYFRDQNKIMEDAVNKMQFRRLKIIFPDIGTHGLSVTTKENCTVCFMK